MGQGARAADTPSHIVGVGLCSSELICVRARPVGASDIGTLSDGRAAPGFKAPVVGSPCDLMLVLGYVLVCVIWGLSREIVLNREK